MEAAVAAAARSQANMFIVCQVRNKESEVKVYRIVVNENEEIDEIASPPICRFVFPGCPAHGVCILGSTIYFFNGYDHNGRGWGPNAKKCYEFEVGEDGPDNRVVRPNELNRIEHRIEPMHYAKQSPTAVVISDLAILVFGRDVLPDSRLDGRIDSDPESSRVFELYHVKFEWIKLPKIPHGGCDRNLHGADGCVCGRIISYSIPKSGPFSLLVQTGNGSFLLYLDSMRSPSPIGCHRWFTPADMAPHVPPHIPQQVEGHFVSTRENAQHYLITSDARRFQHGRFQRDRTQFVEHPPYQLSEFAFDIIRYENHRPSVLAYYIRRDLFRIIFLQATTSRDHNGGYEAHILIDVGATRLTIDGPNFIRLLTFRRRMAYVGNLRAIHIFSLFSL